MLKGTGDTILSSPRVTVFVTCTDGDTVGTGEIRNECFEEEFKQLSVDQCFHFTFEEI